VGALQRLEHLFLSCNRLDSVPHALEKLSTLITLDLSFNRILDIASDPRTIRILVM
jgi:Leucine-rich repeat (LRR) protein